MRDPARIDDVLAEIKRAWEHNPDIRLGQLIVNATQAVRGRAMVETMDIFYVEDDVLVDGIRYVDGLNES